MQNRLPALVVAAFAATTACKPRQQNASNVRAGEPNAGASGKFVVAEARPNPARTGDFAELARQLEAILLETGPTPEAGVEGELPGSPAFGLQEVRPTGDAPNGVASLASISWALGDAKFANEALKRLGAGRGETQRFLDVLRRVDAELNKKAIKLNSNLLLAANERDRAVAKNTVNVALKNLDQARKMRDDSMALVFRQIAELKASDQGFAGMECDVVGGSPTLLSYDGFTEENTQEIARGLESAGVSQHAGRGEGVCFSVPPGYAIFVLLAQKRCASGFIPDDPRLTLVASADVVKSEAFAYALPQGELLDSVCFSRASENTMPVSADLGPNGPGAPDAAAGAGTVTSMFKRIASTIFTAPGDCEGYFNQDANLCANAECRAVTSGKISECYSKDCRAIILKRSSACGSTDCRGLIRRVIDDCVSNYCRAIVGNQPMLCKATQNPTEGDGT